MSKSLRFIVLLFSICALQFEEVSSQTYNVSITINGTNIILQLNESDARALAAVFQLPNRDGTTYDIDECFTPFLNNCDENSRCDDLSNSEGQFRCLAEQPPSECDLGTDDCDVNAVCIDTATSFMCKCNPGYVGTGKSCARESSQSVIDCAFVVETTSRPISSTQLENCWEYLHRQLHIGEVRFGEVINSDRGNLSAIHVNVIGPNKFSKYFEKKLAATTGMMCGELAIQSVAFPGPMYYTGVKTTGSIGSDECTNILNHINSTSNYNATCSIEDTSSGTLTFTVQVDGDNFAGFDLPAILSNYSRSNIKHVLCTDESCGEDAFCTMVNGRPTCQCTDGFHDNDPDNPGTKCVSPIASLNCGNADEVDVKLYVDYFYCLGVDPDSLNLLDSACKGTIKDDYIIFNSTAHGCQSRLTNNGTHITYSNEITNVRNGILYSEIEIEFFFACSYATNVTVSTTHGKNLTTVVKTQNVQGTGYLDVQLGLYLNSSFTHTLTSDVGVRIGQTIYVMANHSSTVTPNFLELVNCWLTPTIDPTSSTRLDIIQNSCPEKNGLARIVRNGNAENATIAMTVVKFENYSEFYLHCDLKLCKDECNKTCSGGGNERRRRQTESNLDTLSVGPVKQERSASVDDNGVVEVVDHDTGISDSASHFSNQINGTSMAIIGVLCAALTIAIAVAFVIYRRKGSDQSSSPKDSLPAISNNLENAERDSDHQVTENRIPRQIEMEYIKL